MNSEKSKKVKSASSIIFKRELKSFFTSPTAYIVSGLFLLITGLVFFSSFYLYNRAELRQLFAFLPLILSFFVPALTMRLFAEERRSGSIETLMTLPVNETSVVTGKYLSSLVSTLIMVAPTLFYLLPVCVFGKPDFGPIFGGYLGAIFLCACFAAIGLFASSVTKNQIIAFFLAWVICIVLTMIDQFLIFLPGVLLSFFSFISANAHFNSIARGIIDTRDILYFVSLASFFFVMTVKAEQKAKA
ncbi:MAG: ABC transporter permease subunit [Treponema sp.]|nr:ABC transporter permease subunit [Treponema sp.]